MPVGVLAERFNFNFDGQPNTTEHLLVGRPGLEPGTR